MNHYAEIFVTFEHIKPFHSLEALMTVSENLYNLITKHIATKLNCKPSQKPSLNWIFLMLANNSEIEILDSVEASIVKKTLDTIGYDNSAEDVDISLLEHLMPLDKEQHTEDNYKKICELLQLSGTIDLLAYINPLSWSDEKINILKDFSREELMCINIDKVSVKDLEVAHKYFQDTGLIYGVDYLIHSKDYEEVSIYEYKGDANAFFLSTCSGMSYAKSEIQETFKVSSRIYDLTNLGLKVHLADRAYIDFQIMNRSLVILAASGEIVIEFTNSDKVLILSKPHRYNQSTHIEFKNARIMISNIDQIMDIFSFDSCIIDSDEDSSFSCDATDILSTMPNCVTSICEGNNDEEKVRSLFQMMDTDDLLNFI